MDRQVSTMKEGKKLPEGEVLNPRYLKSCWFLSQRLIAYLQAPVFPADHQKKKKKTTIKDPITSEPTNFDEQRRIFGTASRMAMFEELQMMNDSIAAQGSVIAVQNQRLDLLAPVQAQVIFIRKPALQNPAYCSTNACSSRFCAVGSQASLARFHSSTWVLDMKSVAASKISS